MIIPDFQNLYTNRSYLSREQQIRQFRMLLEMLQEHISDNDERNMQISLHGLLYSILSEAAYGETVFMAADTVSNQLAAVYFEQLRSDNILVTSDLDETMDFSSEEFEMMLTEYLELLAKEMPKQFSLMIFPFVMLEKKLEKWLNHLNHILAYQGQIILYDCPGMISITEDFNMVIDHVVSHCKTIKMFQTNKTFHLSEESAKVISRIKLFSEKITTVTENEESKRDIHELDNLIYEAWELENEVIKYNEEIRNRDLKYNINEIKNGLLDLRYAEERDITHFQEVLKYIINR